MPALPQCTKARKKRFLETFSECANVTEACRLTDIHPSLVYVWRKRDRAFAKDWAVAVERGTDALEDEAVRRALDGCLEPVFYKGVQCGTVRKFSDSLLMFLLRARRPERFRERVNRQPEADPSLMSVLAAIDGTTRGLPSARDRERLASKSHQTFD